MVYFNTTHLHFQLLLDPSILAEIESLPQSSQLAFHRVVLFLQSEIFPAKLRQNFNFNIFIYKNDQIKYFSMASLSRTSLALITT